jgi:DNA repair protein RadA/Sms
LKSTKTKSVFFCQQCGYESPKWLGKCPSCNEWNTFAEEKVQAKGRNEGVPSKRGDNKPQLLEEIAISETQRRVLKDGELNRVLGGGLVPGSVILFGGEPGIGKSTLMLQLAMQQPGMKTLYVSGEESLNQMKMRSERIGKPAGECYMLAETDTDHIISEAIKIMPDLLVADSIQTLFQPALESAPGSVSQVRECAAALLRFAKENDVPVFLIGHITKEGSLAGPKVLEHMVDTVLQFEGDRHHAFRLLRTIKNRFGNTHELGIYEMTGNGLNEIPDPSQVLTNHRESPVSGVAVGVSLEGMRPLMIEVQALVSSAAYGTPQRSSTGFDIRRMNMLLAVLEKRCGFRLGMKDVFLNMAGGIRAEDPGLDLAIACSILSSGEDIPLPSGTCFAAELGLTGELRPVSRVEQRIKEAARLGYRDIYISGYGNMKSNVKAEGIQVHTVNRVDEVFGKIFGGL